MSLASELDGALGVVTEECCHHTALVCVSPGPQARAQGLLALSQ